MPSDPRGLRGDAPALDAWLAFHGGAPTPFTIPGHKQRLDLVGDVVAGDVPLFAGLDTMSQAHGVLAAAEARAARLWGADVCRFSVGGSTHGNQALALAVGAPGDRVIVSRTLHRSLLLGLVLAGLTPVWVRPDVDDLGMPRGIPPRALTDALALAPDAVAVFIGDPSYVGTLTDIEGLAAVAHAHRGTRARGGANGIPLVVDAAWGAHFGFHPALPGHALARGADALVTSAHKTLPAWSQGALVLAQTERIDPARLAAAVDATATTSPSGAILASIDASRALVERDGPALLGDLVGQVADLRARLRAVPGLVVLDGPGVDPVKVCLVLSGTGADGTQIEADLIARRMPVELADRDTIVAMVTLADTPTTLRRLEDALVELVEVHRGTPRPTAASIAWSVAPQQVCPPRAAFFARQETVAAARAVGRTCGELVAPYPPGIPVLAPGELITEETMSALRAARAAGTRIAYAADPTLATVRVLAD
ncbi:MAG TPA: hypothetical protein PKI09_00735 [Dermatophilaceae bacterium]|jgi:arginine decarboxylase|nr:hypothetical protein [Dermatophilaceae bacterium]HOA56485.1 hypothetical protein [Dermatophilaceae bacterium]HPZ67337.1 hypothetical protein [Dermatophilaceae bacterium]HQD01667.1 hypothetical protein [Dermatophilaceae bacterium]